MYMQTITAVIATAALCFALFAVYDKKNGAGKITLSDESMRTISVTGKAERFVAPDTASISFALIEVAPSITVAKNSVNERMTGLLTTLKSFEIAESDIKTQSYNVSPKYRYEGETRNRSIDGYQVSQNIQVKIRKIENLEKVLGTIGSTGIDSLNGPHFFVNDDEEIHIELRKEAIQDAKQKAKKLGDDLGVRLRTIVGFREDDARLYADFARTASFDAALSVGEEVAPQIPIGENELQSFVTVIFEIE